MTCPICSVSRLPNDVSMVEKRGKRVILQGEIHAIVAPGQAHYPPFANYFTVSLYPGKFRKGRVKYLKFKTQDEVDKWGFAAGRLIRCDGCLHETDGQEVVFDVTGVVSL